MHTVSILAAPATATPAPGPTLSLVTPAFREAENLPVLYRRICAALELAGIDWEWIIVDDHSPDDTFAAIESLAHADARVRGLRLSRNGGSHAAIAVGLAHASGRAAVVLAADLQDPPELIPSLLECWRGSAQVVWAARRAAPGATAVDRQTGRLFHAAMRRLAGFETMPAFGSDCFLLDRAVIDALGSFSERRVNLIALIHWMGFRQVQIEYDKAPRAAGRSGWTLGRKLELVIDSVTAFSVRPIRWMTLAGAVTALVGFSWALVVMFNAIFAAPPSGWSSLMMAVLVLGGLQMLMIGVLGEYLWRTLEESRRRPRALIEAATRAARETQATASAPRAARS